MVSLFVDKMEDAVDDPVIKRLKLELDIAHENRLVAHENRLAKEAEVKAKEFEVQGKEVDLQIEKERTRQLGLQQGVCAWVCPSTCASARECPHASE